jgi:hypothetical protein
MFPRIGKQCLFLAVFMIDRVDTYSGCFIADKNQSFLKV